LIAPDVVLTAQHCVQAIGAVEIGRYNVSDDSEVYEVHVIEREVLHPEYYSDGSKDVDEFDYALLKLYHATQLKNVTVVTVNFNATVPNTNGQELYVMGWGKPSLDAYEERSDYLQQAEVYYIENEYCRTFKSSDGETLDDRVFDITLCAGDFDELDDSCTGDSGGPIVIRGNTNSSAADVQVGITSYGFGCANPELPGIYARTSYVADWIVQNVCEISLHPPTYFNCPPKRQVTSDASTTTNNPELVSIVLTFVIPESAHDNGWILQSENDDGVLVTNAYVPIGSFQTNASSSSSSSSVVFNNQVQIPNNQMYVFTIFDAFGNGGVGVTITDDDDNNGTTTLLSTDVMEFGFSISYNITVGTIPSMSPTRTPAPTSTVQPTQVPTETLPFVSLSIQFDKYPQETGWRLELLLNDDNGEYYQVLQQVYPGTYANYTEEERVKIDISILSSVPETYKFTMTDNERDGLCCGVGIGEYELWMGERLITKGASFQWEDSTVFVVTQDDIDGGGDSSGTATSSSSSSSSARAVIGGGGLGWWWWWWFGQVVIMTIIVICSSAVLTIL
jgi:secreted trypsin-like serine protease